MILRAELIYLLMNVVGILMPVRATSVYKRIKASRGELAWTVVRDPSCPVFMA
jgi:hypothetical protein